MSIDEESTDEESTDDENPIALKRSARFLFSLGTAAALVCAYSTIGTLRFISESTLAEGTVVDWTHERPGSARSRGPGTYFRIIEIEAPNGQRIRGQAEVSVEMRRLKIGEQVAVRYRASDPTRMRVVSLSDLWVVELVTGAAALVFGLAGWAFIAQARKVLEPGRPNGGM